MEQAICLYQHLTDLCAKGGFNLNKWVSNHRSVLAVIPEVWRDKDVKTLDCDREQLPMERALGSQWNVQQDVFTFSMEVRPHVVARHGILSVVSSMYDPLRVYGTCDPASKTNPARPVQSQAGMG